jgi:hypothetical protein
MSETLNHTCSICGSKYHACVGCSDVKSFTPWKTIVDTIEHYKIFIILRDYTNQTIDVNEAKKLLLQRDLVGLENFNLEIKNVIGEILEIEDSKEAKVIKSKK